jgi:hypothetical protein
MPPSRRWLVALLRSIEAGRDADTLAEIVAALVRAMRAPRIVTCQPPRRPVVRDADRVAELERENAMLRARVAEMEGKPKGKGR